MIIMSLIQNLALSGLAAIFILFLMGLIHVSMGFKAFFDGYRNFFKKR